MCNMGLANITLPIFLVFVVASSAFSDYPPKNPDMISRDQLVSLPYSKLGVASYHMHMHVQSELSKRTLPLLVGGKGDEGGGLGFLEQPLLAWTAIAANTGAVGRGNNGNRNLLGPKKVPSGLVIMLILLKIFGELGFLQSRKETRAVNSWATMSFFQLSFKEYDDILQCLEGSPEQHPRVVVLGSVDKGNGGAEGVLRENWSSQDLMSFEGKGGGNGTGGDGPKRFGDSCFKLLSMVFTDLLFYPHLQPLYSDSKDGLIEATNCFVEATNYHVETGGGSNSGEEEESGGGSASVGNMVGYLCCIASVLLVRRRPPIAEVFEGIGFAAIATGFLLMTAMFLPNYLWIVGIACVALLLVVALAFMIRH
uniref:Uncharacterized protein n=1 Tax=Quercus lobata TaxID=97700 RepID=A0A7N2MSU8_QUELO